MEQWIQQFWSELDRLGEEEVLVRLANKSFVGVGREEIAREWLRQKRELARAAEVERQKAAREGAQVKAAAEEAASRANTRASIAIMIAVTAAIISVLSLVAQLLR